MATLACYTGTDGPLWSPAAKEGNKCVVLLHGGSVWGKRGSVGGALTVLEVGGAEGLVSETISWMARRSFKRCSALLMPISLWISVSDRADMMAPLFTLARQAATYQAGIPTQSCQNRAKPVNVQSTCPNFL